MLREFEGEKAVSDLDKKGDGFVFKLFVGGMYKSLLKHPPANRHYRLEAPRYPTHSVANSFGTHRSYKLDH